MSSASMASSRLSSEPREMPTIVDQPDSSPVDPAAAETVREGWLTCKVAAVDGKVSDELFVCADKISQS